MLTAPRSLAQAPFTIDGKFLRADGCRFFIKGVTYGTFPPNDRGLLLPPAPVVARDFATMARAGINTVRLYTPPDRATLDQAAAAGLRVMIGLPWAQHVAFLDDAALRRQIRDSVKAELKTLASHPAAMLFAIGNEIPPDVVRWHGRHAIERFLRQLYDDAKSVAPDALLTYANYPPTEYLDLSFFDVCSFNIYLHDRAAFASYLARVQHIAGHKPLLISELGGDSVSLSADGQASLVAMQLRTAFTAGACGAVAFSWTDEWWRGGDRVRDWAFGLVDAARVPKPALAAVTNVYSGGPFANQHASPLVSVVVCAYNAADTVGECLASLEQLRYPNFEIVFVDDGSTDSTCAIARQFRSVRVIDSPNGGLSAARNLGLAEARGEIVAYTDADVRVDPDWLSFLVQPFLTGDIAGCGGPNVVPKDDGFVAQCVARSPGSPTPVLLDDVTAEHVTGCNMAFRRAALVAIGGFDPTFTKAGDDVDLCWRLQSRGWRLGYAPSALVWHRHRGTTAAYYRQQVGYGEGETWLMYRHPSKFVGGRIAWDGHIYSPLPIVRSFSEAQVHTGPFGRTAFPSVYRTSAAPWTYLPHSGRWLVGATALVVAGVLAFAFDLGPGGWLAPAGLAALLVTAGRCVMHGVRSDIAALPRLGRAGTTLSAAAYRAMIAWLHFLQPIARVHGRLRGLYHAPPARSRPGRAADVARRRAGFAAVSRWLVGRPIEQTFWSTRWLDPHELFARLVRQLRSQRVVRSIVLNDGWSEDCDVMIESGWALRIFARVLVEDHGVNGSLCRVSVRARPRGRCAAAAGLVVALLAAFPAPSPLPVLAAVGGVVVALTVAVARAWRVFDQACAAAAMELGLRALTETTDERDAAMAGGPAAAGPTAPVDIATVRGRRPAPRTLPMIERAARRVGAAQRIRGLRLW